MSSVCNKTSCKLWPRHAEWKICSPQDQVTFEVLRFHCDLACDLFASNFQATCCQGMFNSKICFPEEQVIFPMLRFTCDLACFVCASSLHIQGMLNGKIFPVQEKVTFAMSWFRGHSIVRRWLHRLDKYILPVWPCPWHGKTGKICLG